MTLTQDAMVEGKQRPMRAASVVTGMSNVRRILSVLGASTLLGAIPCPLVAAPAASVTEWGFLDQYCVKCHNAEDWAGGVAFDTIMNGSIAENADTLEKAVRKLRGHLMPPADKPQPEPATARAFVSWLERGLDGAAAQTHDPGLVGLHRLNRKEYVNAVRDLLDLSIDPVALLPKDDAQDGFDNIAAALQISPNFLDQYLAAARSVAVQALGNRAARPAGAFYTVKDAGTQHFYREGLPLGTRGGMAVDHSFPADGDYVMNIGDMAQSFLVYNMEFENTVVVTIDEAEIFRTTIGGEADLKAIDQRQEPAVDEINQRLKNIHFQAQAGTHRVGVAFVRRTFAESEDRLQLVVPGGGQDRVLRVTSFEIRGPFAVSGVHDTPSRERILICRPTAASEEEHCAERILSDLARRAYRRTVSPDDMRPLVAFYRSGRAAGDFETGIRKGLMAILASPDFLFRAESPLRVKAAGEIVPISDPDLAARLSFFLWSSPPDDALLATALAGRLHEPAVLERETRRLLADPRAQALTTNFAFQWLNIAKLSEIEPDERAFPYASGEGDLREDFRTELRLFIDSVFRDDRSVLDLLDAHYTFVNERLALHYGMPGIKGAQFQHVTLTQSARYGLLGKGAVLMSTSYPTRTAPVLRGQWILQNILGTPPAAPPAGVPTLKENEAGKKPRSVRELMEAHRANPKCFSCHGVMDPLGIALENFDATGKYRELDRDTRQAVDAAGKLTDGTVVTGPDDLRKALLAQPDQFVQTITEKLMTFALGRSLGYYDMPTVRAITRACAQNGYRFSTLVTQIVASAAFQKRRASPGDDLPGGDPPHPTQTASTQ